MYAVSNTIISLQRFNQLAAKFLRIRSLKDTLQFSGILSGCEILVLVNMGQKRAIFFYPRTRQATSE
jgi:hypothetical protein